MMPHHDGRSIPDVDDPPAEHVDDLVRVPPPRLEADSLEDFLEWAASVPQGAIEDVRSAIAEAAARRDESLILALTDELERLPVEDISRHMVLLATIGELRDAGVADALEKLVWHRDLVYEPYVADAQGCSFEASSDLSLRVRAAEMLAYLGTEDAAERTLRIVADHDDVAVRAAAIDAYLYNHGDSDEALERVGSAVRADDVNLVGVPRFTRESDPQAFEAAVEEFYRQHPDQLPPDFEVVAAPRDRDMTAKEPNDV